MTLTRPRAAIFDWDNTLVDSWAIIHDAMNVTLEAMGHPKWSYDETRARVRRALREAFPDLFGDSVVLPELPRNYILSASFKF